MAYFIVVNFPCHPRHNEKYRTRAAFSRGNEQAENRHYEPNQKTTQILIGRQFVLFIFAESYWVTISQNKRGIRTYALVGGGGGGGGKCRMGEEK